MTYPLSKWYVSSANDMSAMFSGTKEFNGDISQGDVSDVIDMSVMFSGGVKAFNGDLSKWYVSSANDMSEMFSGTTVFNGDISLAVGCIRAMVIDILIINLIMIHILFYNLYINLIGMIINHPIGRFTIVP